jgi:drug/metabolite transporter (DMT)-like permease
MAPVREPVARSLAYAGLGLTTVGWASGFVAGKVVLAELTPLATAAWRYAIASAVLLPFAFRARPRHGVGAAVGPLAVMVLCGGVLYPWLFLVALGRTSATNTALLIALNPVMTVLALPLVGEPFERRRLGGIVVALAGAATVITRGDPSHLSELSFASGDLIAVAAAAMWATFNLASRSVVGHLAPPFVNCVVYGLGGLALWTLGRGEHPGAQLAAATPLACGGLVCMALLSSVLAGQLFLVGVHALGISRTVVFVYLVPVLTALLSVTLLGERFVAAQAVGGAGVLAGIVLTTRTRV